MSDRADASTAEGWVRVRVDILAVEQVDPETAVRALHRCLATLAKTWRPAQLRFTMSAGGDRPPAAAWTIGSDQLASATALAEDLRAVLMAYAPAFRLGPATPVERSDTQGRPVADLSAHRSASVEYYSFPSPFWRVAAADTEHRWTLSVELDAVTDRDGVAGSAMPADVLPEVPSPGLLTGTALVAARLRLHGSGDRAEIMAALLSEDTCGPFGLVASPARLDGSAPELTWLPLDLAGYVLAAPARLSGAFPQSESPTSAALFAMIEASATPHVLVLGRSGQGKSEFLSHFVDRACRLGETSFTVDVHDGRLVDNAVRSARRHERPVVLADFSVLDGTQPCLDITAAPSGIAPEQWAADLYLVLRSVLWETMPDEFFGPVGERALRAMLNVAVLDPAHEIQLVDLPRLFTDRGAGSDLLEVLQRIDRADLTTVVCSEILPMLRGREAGNSAIFLMSKFGPLVDDPALRAIARGGVDTLGVERALAGGATFALRAPAATLGDTGSRIVAALAVHRLWLAVRRRDTPSPVHVVGDEWQQYATSTFEAMLSQGRKFGVRLRLANQNLAQLPDRLRHSALGNSGTLACFRLGPADAGLVDGLYPTVPKARLQTLPTHHVALTFGDSDLVVKAPDPLWNASVRIHS